MAAIKVLRAADLFCGAGGSSTGLANLCRKRGIRLDLTAVNHWPIAVETHSANHPAARHLCETLDSVDPRKFARPGKLDLLMASPECTHHSRARGGVPVNDQSRATAWHVIRWAEALRPRWILVENVQEFRDWGPIGSQGKPLKSRKGETFTAWLRALEALGYTVGHRVLNAADYGAATSRQRLFVQAVRGREQIRWPEPTHTRNPRQDLFGSLLPWRGAREVIDWSVKGQSIFTRKRPLRENTLRRIRAGLEKFGGAAARPFLMMLSQTGSNGSRMREVTDPLPTITSADDIGIVEPFTVQFKGTSPSNVPYTARRVDQPLGTITGGGGDFGVIEPMILSAGGPEVAARPVTRPVNTLLGRDQMAVVEPLILGQQSGAAARPVSEPLPTVAGAGAISITQPFLVPTNYGERPGQAPRTHGVNAPLPTVVGSVTHGLVQPYLVPYYGTGEADSLNDPARTLTGRDRLGLVEPVEPIPGVTHDILFRMLLPSELAAAMSFPPDYVFKGNRGQVVKQIGNAVDCLQMEVLAGALVDAYLARCA